MSTLDVVAEVLREAAPRALKAREIAALAGPRLPTASRTPQTVVSRDLALDVKFRGASSRFLRVGRGEFVLKEALPTAFYNDNDAYAASWTRNLVAAGEIAAGVVDERSIRDLKPADVASYRQCHFFSGIGVWSRALRDAGWPDDIHVWTGSCPCQPLSQAGQRRGFADERHLWPEWFRLIAACRPAVVVGEQVSSKDGLAWLDLVLSDLEGADYTVRAIDIPAASVGGPHARQRLYFVAYARERGRAIVSAPWLHDRGQPGDDALGRGAAHDGDAGVVPDAAGARPRMPQDAGTDRGDAGEGTEALQRGAAGDLEPQRGGAPDEARAVPDAERVMWHAGWTPLAHGRSEIEPDRHGEVDGAGRWRRSRRLGVSGGARGGRDAGEVHRAQGTGEGEGIEAGDLAHEPGASGAADGTDGGIEGGLVRGAAAPAGDSDGNFSFRPGDRIRIGDDPGWRGAVRGFWARDVEWIYCRPEPGHQDGRWRPAESGTQPLLDGLAPSMGRTRAKRLRGFGNAIVLPLATAFVASAIDAFVDAARALGVDDPTSAVSDPAGVAASVAEADPAITSEPVAVPEASTTAEDHAA